jgi:hypothetical protein
MYLYYDRSVSISLLLYLLFSSISVLGSGILVVTAGCCMIDCSFHRVRYGIYN